MKRVAIFRHSPGEGAGYFATFLNARRIPWQVVAVDAGDPVPQNAADYSGLCFMGGPMSVNDDMPWIPAELKLIRQAVDIDVPVLGHCLGGQLMAKALGAEVTRNAVKEIGWGEVELSDGASDLGWLGDTASFLAFHWHGESFSLPAGATQLLRNTHCANQAFTLGPHLAMQCHVEMTCDMVRQWADSWMVETGGITSPSVQGPQAMLADLQTRVASLNAIAERLYERWARGLQT